MNGVTQFYAMLSTVIQDPNSGAIYESQQIGPVTCGFVSLNVVAPTDFLALQRKEDVAGRYMGHVYNIYPNLDMTPRKELRDLFIDPFSLEVSNQSVREWFSRVSVSVSALSQIDDANADGISDSFDSSPIKQQIARAYGLTNSTDVQNFIDQQFDINGEKVGRPRKGEVASVVTLTCYTYILPTSTVTIPVGTLVGTSANSETTALTFVTTGSAVVTAASAASFYNSAYGWWSVNIPAQCTSTGSVTNVNEGAITNTVTPLPAGWGVTNLNAAEFGDDQELNSKYAARIENRYITGIDSGTRGGLLDTALATPGIISAQVVAAGDLYMLRDWDSLRRKHVYGCVDIYTQGTSSSQQTDSVPYSYVNSSPDTAAWVNSLTFTISPAVSDPSYPYYTPLEFAVNRTGSATVYFGVTSAQYNNSTGQIILNGNDLAYQYVGDANSRAKVPVLITLPGASVATAATNTQLLSIVKASGSYQVTSRYLSPLLDTPGYQPLLNVNSVVGAGVTGAVATNLITLTHTSDFLLYGGSNEAGDYVNVATNSSVPVTKTITVSASTPTVIDSAMDVPLSTVGVPLGINSVLSTDLSTVYSSGIDYNIVPMGLYHQYGIELIPVTTSITGLSVSNNMLTLVTNNNFQVGSVVTIEGIPDTPSTNPTYLNGASFTIATSNNAGVTGICPVQPGVPVSLTSLTATLTGTRILHGQQLTVGYNQFPISENLTFQTESLQVLASGVLLSNTGFVYNVAVPESYGYTALTLDGWNGNFTHDSNGNITGLDTTNSTGLVGNGVPYTSRYIKVVYNGSIMRENTDFMLSVDAATGTAGVARIVGGGIPEGGLCIISYYTNEVFSISTQYPAFVEALVTQIAQTQHACGDVIVKSKLASPVDITLMVVLENNATPETMDPIIRTAVGVCLSNANGTLDQSEIVGQVRALTGVKKVVLPLIKCAKSDGAYDVGVTIPTQTNWIPIGQDPAFAKYTGSSYSTFYISANQVLSDSTIPSGGAAGAFVNILDQGDGYTRTMSITEFLTSPPQSFYIIGSNDSINASTPLDYSYSRRVMLHTPVGITPALESFLVTYQVYGEGGVSDISISPIEYLSAGRITVLYGTGN
jgi:hypothetical protein